MFRPFNHLDSARVGDTQLHTTARMSLGHFF